MWLALVVVVMDAIGNASFLFPQLKLWRRILFSLGFLGERLTQSSNLLGFACVSCHARLSCSAPSRDGQYSKQLRAGRQARIMCLCRPSLYHLSPFSFRAQSVRGHSSLRCLSDLLAVQHLTVIIVGLCHLIVFLNRYQESGQCICFKLGQQYSICGEFTVS